MTQNPATYARMAVLAAVALTVGLLSHAIWPGRADAVGANPASNVTVTCAPDQQALVQQVAVGGDMQTAVRCVGTTLPFGVVDRSLVANDAGYMRPAVLESGRQDVVTAAAPVPRTVTRTPTRKRSWEKTALVIGGSAGAGAGIGGLAGGRKGALIGAAIGGGAATLYEAIKR